MVHYGNLYYFFGIGLSIGYIAFFYFLLRNKTNKTRYTILLIMAFVGFALHFLKQLVYWDIDMLRKSTLENICAISTVIFPILLLSKKKDFFLNDFTFTISIIGGVLALFIPTEALNKDLFTFESIRFYFCHANLCMLGIMTGVFGFHTPQFKRIPYFLLGFLTYQVILCANTALLCYSGMVRYDGFTATELFLDNQYLNNSFTFGPTKDMGFATKAFDILIPSFMKYELNGRQNYWPVVSLTFPSIYLLILYFVVNLPFILIRKHK